MWWNVCNQTSRTAARICLPPALTLQHCCQLKGKCLCGRVILLPDFCASLYRECLAVASFLRFSRIEEINMKFFPVISTTTFYAILCLISLLSQVSQFAVVYFGCDKIICQTNIPYIDKLSTEYFRESSKFLNTGCFRKNGTFPQCDLFRQAFYRLTKIKAFFLADIDKAPTKLMLFHDENA